MSAEAVFENHHAAVKREAEKYAKAALKEHNTDVDAPQQIKILTDTFKKFSTVVNSYIFHKVNARLFIYYFMW